jgi:hypothetical protein
MDQNELVTSLCHEMEAIRTVEDDLAVRKNLVVPGCLLGVNDDGSIAGCFVSSAYGVRHVASVWTEDWESDMGTRLI